MSRDRFTGMRFFLMHLRTKGNAIDMTRLMTVEIEGQEKPALIAEWIGRTVFA